MKNTSTNKKKFSLKSYQRPFLVGLACSLFAFGCSSNGNNEDPIALDELKLSSFKTNLSTYSDCNELKTDFQDKLLQKLKINLDNQKNSLLENYEENFSCNSTVTHGGYDGPHYASPESAGEDTADAAAPTTDDGSAAGSDSDVATNFTTTNIYEAGADEPDFMKNTGEHLFVGKRNAVEIYKIWPQTDFAKISEYTIEHLDVASYNKVQLLLASSDKLVLVYQKRDRLPAADVPSSSSGYAAVSARPDDMMPPCFGDDCYYGGRSRVIDTVVEVIDISDPSSPTQISSKIIKGAYTDARLIAGKLHVVTNLNQSSFSHIDSLQYNLPSQYELECGEEKAILTKNQYELLLDEITRVTLAETTESLNQQIDDFIENQIENQCQNVYHASEAEFSQILANADVDWQNTGVSTGSVAVSGGVSTSSSEPIATLPSDHSLIHIHSVKIEDSSELIGSSRYVFGKGQMIYANSEVLVVSNNFYLGGLHHIPLMDSTKKTYEATQLHLFKLDDDYHYLGSGVVPGRLINPFTLNYHNNHLRVATLTHYQTDSDSSATTEIDRGLRNQASNVYVLDNSLSIVGHAEGIGENENLYSARFVGKRGYLVTFKKVDPFFVIDLEDPTNPIVRGELKMPGYSSYLHPINENLVFGLGKDTIEATEGDFAWFQGLKLALFDVSDSENPKLVSEVIIGGRGTESQALHNHHAFSYHAQSQTLVFPIQYYSESTGSDSSHGEYQYKGAHAYKIVDDEIIAAGVFQNTTASSGDYYGYSSPYLRSILMGDEGWDSLYLISDQEVTHFDFADERLTESLAIE